MSEPVLDEMVRSTCPRDCYDSCGIAVRGSDASGWRITGDPSDVVSKGQLCGKCAIAYNGSILSRAGRLASPLRRLGDKGAGVFQEISWEEAITQIAKSLRSISIADGSDKIVHTHYCGTRALLARDFPLRFFNRLGAREVIPETICYSAGATALEYVFGTPALAFDTRELERSACVVLWGVNANSSSPHADRWLRSRSGKLVVIDPVRHPTAQRADLHLQPAPGTDALLAFGLMRIMMSEGLLNRSFIDVNSIGLEELEPIIARVRLDLVEQITGVSVQAMEAFAHLYAPGPSLLWMGMGLQRRKLGGNTIRTVALLPVVTGNMRRPGAGLTYVNGMGSRGVDFDYLAGSHLRASPVQPIAHPDFLETLNDPQQARALICWNNNVVASCPRQDEMRRALARVDLFTVVIDLYQTDTADYADIVLPAADFTEVDDIVYSYLFMTVGPQRAFREPYASALPNSEIFRRLSRAMGFDEPALYDDDRAVMAEVLSRMGWSGSLDGFLASGNRYWPLQSSVQFADGCFPTPSGKIEIASARALADGFPLTPQPLHEELPPLGAFWLLSPGHRWLSNSSFGQFPEIRDRLRSANILLHPDDAEVLGLQEGDYVEVAGSAGIITLQLSLSRSIRRGVAISFKNRWPKHESTGRSLNAIIGSHRSDYGNCFAPHSEVVTIKPISKTRGLS